MDPKRFLESLFAAAVEAADPSHCIRQFMPKPPKGKTVIVGAGKGSAQLARAFESHWPASLGGAVVTRYGYATPCERVNVIEAAHPVPDAAGVVAAEHLLRLVRDLTADDLVIALICGGGSALLPSPPPGFTLDDEIALNTALLKSGAPISVMNAIRKQFSRIKGGRLAAAAFPAPVITLVVSDIPGDDAALVSSGPTIATDSSPKDALCLAELHNIVLPGSIADYLKTASLAPSPNDKMFAENKVHLIASASLSLEAAAAEARRQGIDAVILSDALEGEAREAGMFHAALAREIRQRARPFKPPVVLLSGGETTVTLKGNGKGGRNTEFLLSFARQIEGMQSIHALAADTDGIDGSEDNAGAFADGSSVARMAAAGISAEERLVANDAWTAFSAIKDLFVCGPTGTNVNDFRAILIS